MKHSARDLPVIDVAPLRHRGADTEGVVAALEGACVDRGFFYIVGHGVDPQLIIDLESAARRTFALPDADKELISITRGGPAWRGWFPLGGELTSGRPDRKEGLYFGQELSRDDPRVVSGRPLHGPNQFPEGVPELRDVVLRYLDALTPLGHLLVRGLALSLGLDPAILADITDDPTILFRIFRYPPEIEATEIGAAEIGGAEIGAAEDVWGVAEHTDYGLLTIVLQDEHGGLEVRTGDTWSAAPPLPGSFVCNIGDMLDRMTAGRYRSTPHRVRNTSGVDRLSFPFFFDPSWDARAPRLVVDDTGGTDPIRSDGARSDGTRWDGADVHAFDGTYGDYLVGKVAKVFPGVADKVL